MIKLMIPPTTAPIRPRMRASYRNILRTSPFSVPIESRIPISWTRSLTDIIITLKMLTAATTRELPPIAMMNVVIVPRVLVIVESRELASLMRITSVFRLTFLSMLASVWLIVLTSCRITLTWLYTFRYPKWSVYHWSETMIALSVLTLSEAIPLAARIPATRTTGLTIVAQFCPILMLLPTPILKLLAIVAPTSASFPPWIFDPWSMVRNFGISLGARP